MIPVLLWLDSTLYDGLPFAIVTVAFLLTFRYLRFADLTTAGTFVLGGAVAASLTVHAGVPAHVAVLLAAVAGALGGTVTAVLITRFRVEPLLAGIVSAFALYSVNLLMLRPTLPYGGSVTVLTRLEAYDRSVGAGAWHPTAILYFAVALAAVKVLLDLFLSSEAGLALRALEDQEAGETTLDRLGVNQAEVKWVVIGLSNALVGLSGALVSMKEGAANAHRGFDVVITGLVAFVIGSRLISPVRAFAWLRPTSTAIGGSLVYFGAVGASFRLGIPAEFTKLLLAALVALLVADTTILRKNALRKPLHVMPSTGTVPTAVMLSGVTYRYPSSDVDVLTDVSMSIRRNEFVLIRGENGSGKTTLVKLIAGILDRPVEGTITIGSEDLTDDPLGRRSRVAYVDQLARVGVVENITVEENLALARLPRRPRPWRRAMTAGLRAEFDAAFVAAGLDTSVLSERPHELSGGQRQIVNLARIIVRPEAPAVVVADEPASNLDAQNQARVWALLSRLHERGSTILVVVHGECLIRATSCWVVDKSRRSVQVSESKTDDRWESASPR